MYTIVTPRVGFALTNTNNHLARIIGEILVECDVEEDDDFQEAIHVLNREATRDPLVREFIDWLYHNQSDFSLRSAYNGGAGTSPLWIEYTPGGVEYPETIEKFTTTVWKAEKFAELQIRVVEFRSKCQATMGADLFKYLQSHMGLCFIETST